MENEKVKIGVTDTMFARGDMGSLAEKTIQKSKYSKKVEVLRYTVPGFKDLAVACKKLIEEQECEIVIACGMGGKADIDYMCAHEAAQGIMQVQLMTNKHVIEVFVFENESKGNDKVLAKIMRNRTVKHTLNALDLVFNPKALQKKAGTGQRQGFSNEKTVKL
ncbi:MAG: riboflavin synthase [Candidatus Diapherotrites archaeon]|nr:riboflavin synthase [Candidatus Diapherotrites archaeon]